MIISRLLKSGDRIRASFSGLVVEGTVCSPQVYPLAGGDYTLTRVYIWTDARHVYDWLPDVQKGSFEWVSLDPVTAVVKAARCGGPPLSCGLFRLLDELAKVVLNEPASDAGNLVYEGGTNEDFGGD